LSTEPDPDRPPLQRESRDWLHAGSVSRPHGLDGSFLVKDANPELLAVGATVMVAGSPRTIERQAGYAGRMIIRLEGCGNREQAEALRGQVLLASRDHAPELDEDEWWAEDLEGCSVHDGDRQVGTVSRLLALPSCEVLEVAPVAGGEPLLVPLVSDAVRLVDLERKAIEIDLVFLGLD
jgi:16S rRNA processing protein RimM